MNTDTVDSNRNCDTRTPVNGNITLAENGHLRHDDARAP